MPATARIGCAGWSIPSTQRHRFDDGDSVLASYASVFDAVEINSSFYRRHRESTWARWAASVPRNFRFSVKIPRTITHDARLREADTLLDEFFGDIAALGNTLGGVLVQMPPSLVFTPALVDGFLQRVRARYTGPIALEPRHRSWFDGSADALLRDHDAARVAADPARAPGAASPGAGTRWRYWRWHGSPHIYYSDYDEAALRALATVVAATAGERWIVFDNTAQGHAVPNALRLRDLLANDAERTTATRPQ